MLRRRGGRGRCEPSPGHAARAPVPPFGRAFLLRRHLQVPLDTGAGAAAAGYRAVRRVGGETRDLVLGVRRVVLDRRQRGRSTGRLLEEYRVRAEGARVRLGRVHAAHRGQRGSSTRGQGLVDLVVLVILVGDSLLSVSLHRRRGGSARGSVETGLATARRQLGRWLDHLVNLFK